MRADFRTMRLVSKKYLNADTQWLTFDGPVDAQPGQFVMVWLPGIGEKPFSIAWMDPLSLLVVDVGPFSHALHGLEVKDQVWIKGPLGQGFAMSGKKLILVGGGYGAAPLLPLAVEASAKNRETYVCLGARSSAGLLLADTFTGIGCQVFCATEDGSKGHKGLVTQLVEKVIQENSIDHLFACGPGGMLSALANLCKGYQVNYQLSWEAHMRCGMGLCGSCEVPISCDPALPIGWLACFDGPVFKRFFSKNNEDCE